MTVVDAPRWRARLAAVRRQHYYIVEQDFSTRDVRGCARCEDRLESVKVTARHFQPYTRLPREKDAGAGNRRAARGVDKTVQR
jgi:hypothetical protein